MTPEPKLKKCPFCGESMSEEKEAEEQLAKELRQIRESMSPMNNMDYTEARSLVKNGWRKSNPGMVAFNLQELNTELTLHTPLMASERQMVLNVMAKFALPQLPTEEEIEKILAISRGELGWISSKESIIAEEQRKKDAKAILARINPSKNTQRK